MTAGLDLFYLFVENVFGGVLISIVGFMALFFLIGIWSKMSVQTIVIALGMFLMTMMMGFLGALGAFAFGLIGIVYFFQGFTRWITAGGGN